MMYRVVILRRADDDTNAIDVSVKLQNMLAMMGRIAD